MPAGMPHQQHGCPFWGSWRYRCPWSWGHKSLQAVPAGTGQMKISGLARGRGASSPELSRQQQRQAGVGQEQRSAIAAKCRPQHSLGGPSGRTAPTGGRELATASGWEQLIPGIPQERCGSVAGVLWPPTCASCLISHSMSLARCPALCAACTKHCCCHERDLLTSFSRV